MFSPACLGHCAYITLRIFCRIPILHLWSCHQNSSFHLDTPQCFHDCDVLIAGIEQVMNTHKTKIFFDWKSFMNKLQAKFLESLYLSNSPRWGWRRYHMSLWACPMSSEQLLLKPGSRWCVNDQDISLPPSNISQKLLDHCILLGTPPYHSIILAEYKNMKSCKR